MRADEVRWCPECDEPHIGGCPWAELEKRADPTVPMPKPEVEPGLRERVDELSAAFARLSASAERHFAIHWLTGAVLASLLVAFAGFGVHSLTVLDAEIYRAESQSRQIHEKLTEIEMNIKMMEAVDEAAREREIIRAERDAETADTQRWGHGIRWRTYAGEPKLPVASAARETRR